MRHMSNGMAIGGSAGAAARGGGRGGRPARRTTHEVPGGRGGVGHGMHGQVRGERVASAEPDDDQQGVGDEDSAGQGDGRTLDGGRGDAARHGARRLRAVRGQRAELRRRHLRGEPAGRDAVGVHHVVPGAAGVHERGQAAAVERGVAGGGGGHARPGAGQRHDRLQHEQHVARWPLTGSRSSCVSSRGAFDMVGNLYEWVADWVPRSTVCGTWSAGVSPTGDDQCLAGAATTGEPGALLRGGGCFDGACAGPLAVIGAFAPSLSSDHVGFRCTGTSILTAASPDLVEVTMSTTPPAPVRAPGTTFPVTDTVKNLGPGASGASTTRYYLSLDAVKGAGDMLLAGSRAVPALAAEASHSGTVTVTIPAATPVNTYFLLRLCRRPERRGRRATRATTASARRRRS